MIPHRDFFAVCMLTAFQSVLIFQSFLLLHSTFNIDYGWMQIGGGAVLAIIVAFPLSIIEVTLFVVLFFRNNSD